MTNVGSCQVLRLYNILKVLNAAVFSWQSFKCLSVSGKTGSVFRNYQNVRDALRDRKQYIYSCVAFSFFFCIPSPTVPHLLADRWEMTLWYETLFIEWSDLFCLHTIHLFSPPWQFSLGSGFNIGQNAICIYISFFIRPCCLSPLKTLRIGGNQWQRI